MKELNNEIKLTIDLMQTDIDDGAQEVLYAHLYRLLEIKRNEIQKRFVEPVNRTDIDGCHTDVYLDEVPNVAFNSVMFENT